MYSPSLLPALHLASLSHPNRMDRYLATRFIYHDPSSIAPNKSIPTDGSFLQDFHELSSTEDFFKSRK